jgi:radical SAM protein with 4Fe4S-binding SPASM domain
VDTKAHTTLASLFCEGKYDEIIKISQSFLSKNPLNISVHYCAAMAYFASTNLPQGLPHLQEIVRSYPHFSPRADNSTNLLIGHIALQLALIMEFFNLMFPDNIMRANEMHQCATVAKAIGKKFNDKTLYEPAKQIFQRLWPVNPKKTSGTETFFPRPDSPLGLQIEPTNYCNLRCRMCSYEKMTRKKGYIDLSLFKEILTSWSNKYKEFSIPHLIHRINIQGLAKRRGVIKLYFMGEPLLHPQLDKLVNIARETGSLVGIQTNGVLLEKPQVRKELLTSQPNEVALSLDGINVETFETIRKGANWQRICEGIKTFHKERENMKLADSISISVSTIIPEDTEEKRQRALTFLSPLRPFVDKIQFIYLNCRSTPYFYDSEGEIKKHYYTPPTSFSENQPLCTEPLEKLNILWDGTITPCCNDIDAEIPLGNVTEGIDAVWEGDKTKSLHKALLNHDLYDFPFCQGCIGYPAH